MKLAAYILLFITTLSGVTFDEATDNFNTKNYI